MCQERVRLLAIYEEAVRRYRAGVGRLKDLRGAEFKAANQALDGLQKTTEEARKMLDRHGREHGCAYRQTAQSGSNPDFTRWLGNLIEPRAAPNRGL